MPGAPGRLDHSSHVREGFVTTIFSKSFFPIYKNKEKEIKSLLQKIGKDEN